ncbi:hypothetical protein K458DRAFT_450661 [Lentithecium fluviatile CBS 122367]|uniref:Uncharacterized protein n=1 Tax=Lentithecium fluviatile CBS 122367 TaxID=1168545 RepID=A0A6G1J2S6_9PLEO|nr:hypothetical protein K458DRAFT_450661 [Lentithecium fluviatile CBS 122367]
MCKEVQIEGVLKVKAYACPPWVARPEVVTCKKEEQARAIAEDYRPGQVDIYIDASVRKGKAGIRVYTTLLQLAGQRVIPGHSRIKGNNEADKLTKAVTEEESEQPPQRNGVPWYLIQLALKRANVTVGPALPRRTETGKFTKKINTALHLGKSAELY